MNPYLRALFHVGWVALTVGALLGLAGLSEAANFSVGAGVVQLAISGWLVTVGGAALLLWLLAGAIAWRPGTRRPTESTSQAQSHWR